MTLAVTVNYLKEWPYAEGTRCGMTCFKNNSVQAMENILAAYQFATDQLRKNNLTSADILFLESYRLVLMQSVYASLALCQPANAKRVEAPEDPNQYFWDWVKILLLLFATVVGAIEMGVWTYYGSLDAVSVILPSILNATVIPVSVLFTVISIIQFVGFEVDQVKKLFGITINTDAQKVLEVELAQIKCAKKINYILDNRFTYTRLLLEEKYQDFSVASRLFNLDIKYKQENFQPYTESSEKKVFRLLVTTFGLILSSIENYFGTVMLIKLAAASMLGTPAGLAIVVTLLASNVVLYFSMRGSGLEGLVNYSFEQSKKMAEQLNKFAQPDENRNKVAFGVVSANLLSLKPMLGQNKLTTQSEVRDQDVEFAAKQDFGTQNVVNVRPGNY